MNAPKSEVQKFDWVPGISLNACEHDGTLWFLLKPVCEALGLAMHKRSYAHHIEGLEESEVSPTQNLGLNLPGKGMHCAKWITESALYKLVLRSNKTEAKPFQDWVTKEVIPSIRKHGGYVTEKTAQEMLDDPEILMAKALLFAQERIKNLTLKTKGLEEKDEATMTVYDFCEKHGLKLTRGQKCHLGNRARHLSDLAGRPRMYGTTEITTAYGTQMSPPVALHTEKALERSAESLGFLKKEEV